MLDAEMTLLEEVREYLRYILALPEEVVERAAVEVQNHLDKIENE